ncbi:GNAT family N-acetyltransferase [Ruegeria litorea]|uniref:GNAT family N-acetyltransferase n=1 Tax=Falsiruegeria litorea TaxID=1280831 RepID=A0ABS5WPA5_9RHOB|nr:GNAT family N-acetyltransferase [Falsiruegeria litorea]MBT3139720.1 GNAT family N-acetyltransferase [Falsiruegeria litorea]
MTRIVAFSGSGLDLGALHCAMLAAFSDYIVPLQPDGDTFKAALSARGFDPEASFVAVDDDEVIGFWNVATRNTKRYLIGSGTRIEHRGRGLASRLGMAAIRAAENAGIESFWLEVIEGNTGAERLYRKMGFDVTRKLDCYRLNHPSPDRSSCELSDFGTVANVIQRYSTWKPSWQNATESLYGAQLTPFLHEKGGVIIGAGGLVHQIAASETSALEDLLAAAATVGSLTLVNVDSAYNALCSLLQELGAHRFIVQSEMRLSFSPALTY